MRNASIKDVTQKGDVDSQQETTSNHFYLPGASDASSARSASPRGSSDAHSTPAATPIVLQLTQEALLAMIEDTTTRVAAHVIARYMESQGAVRPPANSLSERNQEVLTVRELG